MSHLLRACNLHTHVRMCVWMNACVCTGVAVGGLLWAHHVGPGSWTQLVRLGGKHVCLLNYLTCPRIFYFNTRTYCMLSIFPMPSFLPFSPPPATSFLLIPISWQFPFWFYGSDTDTILYIYIKSRIDKWEKTLKFCLSETGWVRRASVSPAECLSRKWHGFAFFMAEKGSTVHAHHIFIDRFLSFPTCIRCMMSLFGLLIFPIFASVC